MTGLQHEKPNEVCVFKIKISESRFQNGKPKNNPPKSYLKKEKYKIFNFVIFKRKKQMKYCCLKEELTEKFIKTGDSNDSNDEYNDIRV